LAASSIADIERHKVVGVMGSGSEPHAARAQALGAWLATAGYHLLTGGGGGVMASVSRAFAETEGRAGSVIGVLPAAADPPQDAPTGYPNPWIEIAIHTHLPARGDDGEEALSRSHINILSAEAVVALPGGAGTLSEVKLALAYGRPSVAHMTNAAELPGLPDAVPVAPHLDDVRAFIETALC
jgi:uncharacterized protein (TIGR00725 family)